MFSSWSGGISVKRRRPATTQATLYDMSKCVCDGDAIAEPDLRLDRRGQEVERIVAAETRQLRRDRDGAGIQGLAARAPPAPSTALASTSRNGVDTLSKFTPVSVVVVEEAPVDGRIAHHQVHGRAGRELPRGS